MNRICEDCGVHYNDEHRMTICPHVKLEGGDTVGLPSWKTVDTADEKQDTVDWVNHPPHYGAHPSGVECITITEHMNFNVGNAVKYLWRADHKNGLEDLKKARWYIDREITRLEKDDS